LFNKQIWGEREIQNLNAWHLKKCFNRLLTQHSGATPKTLTAKGAKAAKENQHLNHEGKQENRRSTRRI
jgi:hypothetical protein